MINWRWLSLVSVALLPVSLSLMGCLGWHAVHAHSDDESVDKAELKSFVGSNKDKVRQRLGGPDYELEGLEKDYFLYYAYGEVDVVLDFTLLVPIPLPGSIYPRSGATTTTHCAVLEFDKAGIFQRYEIDWRTHSSGLAKKRCLELLPEKQQEVIRQFTDSLPSISWRFEFRKLAEKGDPEAQYKLYFLYDDEIEAFKWLCLAANNSQSDAQFLLGHHYQKGFAPVKADIGSAYVWYSLARANGYSELGKHQSNWIRVPGGWRYYSDVTSLQNITQQMTAEKIAQAERLVAEWKPNPEECEVYSEQAED